MAGSLHRQSELVCQFLRGLGDKDQLRKDLEVVSGQNLDVYGSGTGGLSPAKQDRSWRNSGEFADSEAVGGSRPLPRFGQWCDSRSASLLIYKLSLTQVWSESKVNFYDP